MKIRRLSLALTSALLALGWSLATAPMALATTGHVEPQTQSRSHGVASQWDGNFGSTAPYNGTFYYGDGSYTTIATSANTKHFSHTYFPCSSTTYTVRMHVKAYGSSFIDRYATATEAGGNPC